MKTLAPLRRASLQVVFAAAAGVPTAEFALVAADTSDDGVAPPTSSLADPAWRRAHFGGLENLKGKKIAMTWAYSPSYGKPLSVPQGIIGLMSRFGMDVSLAYPEGYGLIPDVIEAAKKNAAGSTPSGFRRARSATATAVKP